MNVTFEVINSKGVKENITFFTIDALGKGEEVGTSTIYSNGMQFTCTIPLGELWDKVKRIKDASAT
jgi:hypothetical protein